MKTRSYCLFGGALIGAGLSNSAVADIAIDGILTQTDSSYGYDYGSGYGAFSVGTTTIDTFDFSVLSGGYVQFDMLSFGIYSTWIDPMVFVFANDGNILGSQNLIDYNDDANETDNNGSLDNLDSFLNVYLEAGEYTVAIGSYFTDVLEVAGGVSFNALVFSTGGGLPTSGQYHLDVFGDVMVPSPASATLLSIGGLIGIRRRRPPQRYMG
jgi:hypothetical protein